MSSIPVFEGETKLRWTDYVSLFRWAILQSFFVNLFFSELRAHRESHLSEWFHVVSLSVFIAANALGFLVLFLEIRSALQFVNPSLKIQIFDDRIVWIEQSESGPPKMLEERFDQYTSWSRNWRGLFLRAKVQTAHVHFFGSRVSRIHPKCFQDNWDAVQQFIAGKVPSARMVRPLPR
jgi:hypothetical protein